MLVTSIRIGYKEQGLWSKDKSRKRSGNQSRIYLGLKKTHESECIVGTKLQRNKNPHWLLTAFSGLFVVGDELFYLFQPASV